MPDAAFPVEVVAGIPVVRTGPEIDVTNAPGLRAALTEVAASGHRTLVVDMSQTHFCDTAGLHALVGAHKHAQASGGAVLLVLTRPAVVRIFTITGLDRVIPHFGGLEEALTAASGG